MLVSSSCLALPFTNQEFKYLSQLNLLDFPLVQLAKVFRLQNAYIPYLDDVRVEKLLLFPVSSSHDQFDQSGVLLALYHGGKLGYWKYGDENWTLLDDTNFYYDDILEYKGRVYAVDRWGTVSWINSSLELIQYAPTLYDHRCRGEQKNLVKSYGDLYAVDMYFDGMRRVWKEKDPSRVSTMQNFNPKAIGFRVYKLNEDWGTWVDVKSLGDRAFVFGLDYSLSISSNEFDGGKGNCIYFMDQVISAEMGTRGKIVLVFQLEDNSINKLAQAPEHSKIFWPESLMLDPKD